MKVVINRCYGGFSLSNAAVLWLRERGYQPAIDEPMFVGESWSNGELVTEDHERMFKDGHMHSVSRTDDLVIECVEVLGKDAWGKHAELEIVEIPDDISWDIGYYDGKEWVEEQHGTW